MTDFITPIAFTKEMLIENGLKPTSSTVVDCADIEVIDKQTIKVGDAAYFLTFDEGLVEVCNYIGISKMYVKKLPDDLFAHTLNYFFRRSAGTEAKVFYNTDKAFVGIQMADVYRMDSDEFLGILKDATGADKCIKFDHLTDSYVVELLGDKIFDPSTNEAIGYAYLRINFNDRLWWEPSYTPGIWLFGGKIEFDTPYLSTAINKNDTPDSVIYRMTEDIESSYSDLTKTLDMKIQNANGDKAVIEDPSRFMSKLLHEWGLWRKQEEIMNDMSLYSYETPNHFNVAVDLAKVAFKEKYNVKLQKKLSLMSGHILSHTHDHRCKSCLSLVEE